MILNLRGFASRLLCTSTKMSKGVKRSNKGETGCQPQAKKPAFNHWANGLLAAMDDPNLRVYSDDRVVVVKDKYPKAQFHFLVLPKQSISSLSVVEGKHLDLLRHMHDVGQSIAKEKEQEGRKFKLGYHAEPSMNHLHLHVISDDFSSECLKTKKHYNSFVTEHFINSSNVIESLKSSGKIILPSHNECQNFLNQPLACFKCGQDVANMPKLKHHLRSHIDQH